MTGEWIEIKARGRPEAKDEAVKCLMDAGSPGVLEEELSDKKPARCTAYIRPEERKALCRLEEALSAIGWTFTTSRYRDRDWSIAWRSGIRPVRLSFRGSSLVVKPTWRKVRKAPGDVVVEIDPSMAFGTGGHPTTRLCLRAILRLLKTGSLRPAPSVLDIGTGTGVLAIAAKKLGAGRCTGVDTDPVALKVARKNARLNRARVVVSSKPVEEVPGTFDLIVANIVSNVLKRLAPVIVKKMRPAGLVILSGILTEEAASVVDACAKAGLKSLKRYDSGEWCSLILGKTFL